VASGHPQRNERDILVLQVAGVVRPAGLLAGTEIRATKHNTISIATRRASSRVSRFAAGPRTRLVLK
jgi:hypothetical protein